MKHIKLWLATMAVLLCSFTATAHDFEVNGIYYNISSSTNKTVEVTYKGTSSNEYSDEYTGSVVIPESVTYNGSTYSVTSIGERAFYYCAGLTSITIPNSVTSIGEYAFYKCTGLTSVVIGNSVTSIGEYAFGWCYGITSITIPNSVTSIVGNAFAFCSGLTSVEFNAENCTTMGSSYYPVFEECTALSTVTIGENVKNIPDYAFRSCSGLTSITIPNSVTSIGNYAFQYCSGLTNVEIGNSVTSIGSEAFSGTAWYDNQPDGVVYAGKVLYSYKGTMPSNTSITIKEGTLGIANFAFEDCTGLTSIEIPNSVTSIGKYAFYDCTGLKSVVIGNSVTSIGNSAFNWCTGLKTVINFSNLTFSKGSSNNGYIAYYADNVYNVPNGSIEGDFIFGKPNDVNSLLYYLGNATELTLPADYKGENYVIEANAFNGNKTITSITIPNSVTSIGYRAFSGCI